MDQKVIAGVGNIYANDALWDAGISPIKPSNTLTQKEIKSLIKSLEKVLKLGIDLWRHFSEQL
jgi:formamidopyrimidine-DNA glycosylase